MVIFFICSAAYSDSGPKIGVVPINIYKNGSHLKPRFFPMVQAMELWINNYNYAFKRELEKQGGQAIFFDLPFGINWTIENYRDMARYKKLDVLLTYDINFEVPDGVFFQVNKNFNGGYDLNAKFEILDTGETSDEINIRATNFPIPETFNQLKRIIRKANEYCSVTYYITSVPPNQALYVDKNYRKLTPKEYTAARRNGAKTSIEVHFLNLKLCRRKIVTIENRKQLINIEFNPDFPEEPLCEVKDISQ
jgi:hypothetical protein